MGRIRYGLKHGENTGIAVGNFGGCRGLSFDLLIFRTIPVRARNQEKRFRHGSVSCLPQDTPP